MLSLAERNKNLIILKLGSGKMYYLLLVSAVTVSFVGGAIFGFLLGAFYFEGYSKNEYD